MDIHINFKEAKEIKLQIFIALVIFMWGLFYVHMTLFEDTVSMCKTLFVDTVSMCKTLFVDSVFRILKH